MISKIYSIASITLVSRILGFCRDLIILYYFGTSSLIVAYFIAMQIPNIFRAILSENIINNSLMPYLQDKNLDIDELRQSIFTISCIFFGFITLCLFFLSERILTLFAENFTNLTQALEYFRILLFSIFFFGMSGIFISFLHGVRIFILPSLLPIFINIGIIGTLVILKNHEKIILILSQAFLILSISNFIYLYILCYKNSISLKLRISKNWNIVWNAIKNMFPTLGATLCFKIHELFNVSFATTIAYSGLFVGAAYYADRLMHLPLSIIGISMGTILLPSLTNISQKEYGQTVTKYIELSLFFGIPAAFGLATLSEYIVTSLFYHGTITSNEVEIIANMVCILSLGLAFSIYNRVIASILYSRKEAKKLLYITCCTTFISIIAGYILAFPLDMEYKGLIYATILNQILIPTISSIYLYSQSLLPISKNMLITFCKILLSGFLMSYMLYILQEHIFDISFMNTIYLMFIGLVFYMGMTYVLRLYGNIQYFIK